jgi:histidine triad (HIT) family protein
LPTVFSRIIDGEIPGFFVWKDDLCVAFMSINPIRRGHTLVVPREEIDHWLDCPPDLMGHLMTVSSQIGEAIKAVFGPARVGMVIAGLEVPHLHIHLVPIDGIEDLDFSKAATSVEGSDLEEAADSIRYVLTRKGAPGVTG